MAKDTNGSMSFRGIDKKLDDLNDTVDQLKKSTYSSRTDNTNNLNSITDEIDDNLDDLLSKINGQNISDISNLYIRLNQKNGARNKDSKSITESLEDFFNGNQQIMDTINLDTIRKSIQAEDYQYDLICKYMPKLEDAIDIKKDNVLASDNFTKDFINIISGKSTKTYIDMFNDRATILKDKYSIQELFEDMYYKASKYGEYFLYHVPYNIAIKKLLERKQRLSLGVKYESSKGKTPKGTITLLESTKFDGKLSEVNEDLSKDFVKQMQEGGMSVKVVFDDSGIIAAPISYVSERAEVLSKHQSLSESYSVLNETISIDPKKIKLEDDTEDFYTKDGFIDKSNQKKAEISDIMCGSVLYEIPRQNIIPIYIGAMPLGYIYIEVENNYIETLVLNGNTYNSLTTTNRLMADDIEKQTDMLVSQIAAMMSDKIDEKFVNANIDLKEQIYAVLRYNDHFNATQGTNMMTVSFIPVEDIHHFYFKMDDKTHRGISDLKKAVVPAMIYCLLYLNTVIGNIGRSQDKRVYYVKQNVEQNVARTLLNVINQLKKGNMGMRQLENMNTIFNIIGKYNDHIIPESQSGDPPIRMEVMQGQNIETPTELLERMEDMAISSTDVPLEFINSVNNVDYASRFTMSNSKFLRKIYKRQSICQRHFTQIFRNLYNWEFKENDTTMKVLLPAPSYLAMNNTQQLIDNVKNYANAVADITCVGKEDEVKQEFVNLFIRNQLGTYIDFSKVDDMIEMAEMNYAMNNNNTMDAEVEDNNEY